MPPGNRIILLRYQKTFRINMKSDEFMSRGQKVSF